MASYLYRTAATAYPCCLPALGEFDRSWSYKTCHGKDRGIADNRQKGLGAVVSQFKEINI